MNGIKDKVVIITGASGGLGDSLGRHLHEQGAKIVLGARRIERLQAIGAELGLVEGAVMRTDVVNPADVTGLAKRAVDLHGRIDVLVNNAGIMPLGNIEDQGPEVWDALIDVNIKGVLYGIHAVLPYMKAQKSGHIINISSAAGHKVYPGFVAYCASKSAVLAISEGLRQELKPYNIRNTVISPGSVRSDIIDRQKGALAGDIRKVYDAVALPAEAFSKVVAFTISQPEEVDINEIVFRPANELG